MKCGVAMRGAGGLEAASRTPCPTTFGTRLHASHRLSVGTLRRSGCDEGTPIACCRSCGCYSSHAAVGLSRVCDGGLRGRRSKIRRFFRGLHPEPGGRHADAYIDSIRHYGRGKFKPAGAQLLVAERLGGVGGGAAACAAEPAVEVPPPPPPFRDELDDLGELDRLMMEAASCPVEDEDDGDIFGHMECDLGNATKRQCRRLEDTAAPESGVLRVCAPARGPGGPPAKRKKLVGKQPPAAWAPTAVTEKIPASLEGLEQRLASIGETPRFKSTEGGSFLEHQCTSMNAVVRFWPSSLAWCVEGPDCDTIDGQLTAPVAGQAGESGDRLAGPPHAVFART